MTNQTYTTHGVPFTLDEKLTLTDHLKEYLDEQAVDHVLQPLLLRKNADGSHVLGPAIFPEATPDIPIYPVRFHDVPGTVLLCDGLWQTDVTPDDVQKIHDWYGHPAFVTKDLDIVFDWSGELPG